MHLEAVDSNPDDRDVSFFEVSLARKEKLCRAERTKLFCVLLLLLLLLFNTNVNTNAYINNQ